MNCPFCKEEIQDGAIKCKHCGSMLDANAASSIAAASNPVSNPEQKTTVEKKKMSWLKKILIGFGMFWAFAAVISAFNGSTTSTKPAQTAGDAKKAAKTKEAEAQAEALSAFPECDSDDGKSEVADAMKNAPLGKTYGLEIIKIKNTHEIQKNNGARNCTGIAMLNDGSTHQINYKFYHDDKDIMVQAEVMGLE